MHIPPVVAKGHQGMRRGVVSAMLSAQQEQAVNALVDGLPRVLLARVAYVQLQSDMRILPGQKRWYRSDRVRYALRAANV